MSSSEDFRLRLSDCDGLKDSRWNLLPGDSLGPGDLETSLVWQAQMAGTLWGEPKVEVCWRPDFRLRHKVAAVLASIAAQSIQGFLLRIEVDEETANQPIAEFAEFVGVPGTLSLAGLVQHFRLSDRCRWAASPVGGNVPTSAEWVCALAPSDLLHPMALFLLLKESLLAEGSGGSDVVGFFETLVDPLTGWPHAVRMISGASRYSIFGHSGMSRSLWVSGSCWNRFCSRYPDILSPLDHQGGAEWPLVASAIAEGADVRRLSLALTAVDSPRGAAYQSRCEESKEAVGKVLTGLAKKRSIGLREWSYDSTRRTGLPAPVTVDEKIATIIPFRDQEELTAATFRSLAAQSISNRVRLVAVDNGSAPEIAARLRSLAESLFPSGRLTWLSVDAPFNFAALNNRGVGACDEPHLLFLNNDVEFLTPGDLERLQGFLSWPEVGMVGGALYYPDGQLQAAGIRFGAAGPEVMRMADGACSVFREVDALTFACAFARRTAFEAAGRLDEVLCPNGFGDALLGHRMWGAGWRTICDPTVAIRHHESKSRGKRPEELERLELAREGVPLFLYGTEFTAPRQEMLHRFGRSKPTLGKRIYRAVKAMRKELQG
tara:strand:- start:4537 stop:6348 length:1812 start_codon:yes stop_codon:yes gene_type:complete